MVKAILLAGVTFTFLSTGSAAEAERTCKEQLAEIDRILADNPELLPGVEQWRDDAQRFCRAGQEEEAKPVLRDIQVQLEKDLSQNPDTAQPATRFR